MNIQYGTFLDNLSIIQYPIKLIKSELPQLVIFCSDEKERADIALVLGQDIGIVISKKIKTPGDIAEAQNLGVKHLFDQGADYVVWVQADMLTTSAGFDTINSTCVPGNEHIAAGLKVQHCRLFHRSIVSNWGVSIIGKNCLTKFVGDGAYLGEGGMPVPESGEKVGAIDIGYMTITQYKNHLSQHVKTWNSDNHNYLLPDKEFLENILQHNRTSVGLYELLDASSPDYYIIEKLNAQEEYNKVKNLL